VTNVITSEDLHQIRKNAVESKSVHLNDCTIIDDRNLLTPKTTQDSPNPVYQFLLKVSHKDYNDLVKEVDEAVRLFGQTTYFFDKPDGYDSWAFSRQDEYRFRDQYNKTGLLPVYSPNLQDYLIPKAQDFILGASESRNVFCSSLKPTKMFGDIPESGSFIGRECSARCNIRVFESGKIYLGCNELTVFAGNS
jgi:hypothetical protein